MTRLFTPNSLQISSSSWNQSRFRFKKESITKLRHVKQYQLLNEFGHGSTCTVYLALNTITKKHVALKEMNLKKLQQQQCMDWLHARHPKHQHQNDGSKRRRIERLPINYTESEILHSLHHDHIVEWVDCFEENSYLYLVTEWVDGTVLVNLRDSQTNENNENDKDLNSFWHSVVTQLVDVLDHLHQQNIIHGDIKPDNILLTKNKQIKLIDFGSAIKLDAIDNSNNNNDGDDMVKTPLQKSTFHRRRRTPAFTPPECIKMEMASPITTKHYETAAEIWSLGMTLYCMVYGNLPFDYPTSTNNKQMDIYHLLQNLTLVPHNNNNKTNNDSQVYSLIDQMLKISPMERITLNQIKRHPWYLGNPSTT